MMTMLEKAITIAVHAHSGQVDRAGQPYIFHVFRVMLHPTLTTDGERIVAALHDVIEDSPSWSLDRLRGEGFPEPILEAVDAVTRHIGDDYDALIRHCAANPPARAVKLADLYDNANIARIPEPDEKDEARVRKYLRAIALLEAA